MNVYTKEYQIELFEKLIEAVKNNVPTYEYCWFFFSVNSEPIPFKKLKLLSDEKKQGLINNVILIYGVIDSISIKSLQYRRFSGTLKINYDINLPFDNDEEKDKYIKYRNSLIGL